MIEISKDIGVPLRELNFAFARSSGPGGQNVNKVNSKAILTWDVTGSASLPEAVRARFLERFGRRIRTDGYVVITSDRFRDQNKNIADCCEKLRMMLEEVAVAPKSRRPTKPGKGAVERRLREKQAHSQKKQSRQRGFE